MTTTETTTIQIPAITIELHPGERYAGIVLDAEGRVKRHLVLLPHRPESRLNWDAAKAWATSVGGELPDLQEQALFTNCKQHLQPGYHWSRQEDEEDASYAWNCYVYYGDQLDDH